MFDLTGRTALVTGAGQGVGEGIAAAFAARGAAVMVNDLVADRARAVAERLAGEGRKAVAVPFDVTDRDAVEEGIAAGRSAMGEIDILVNNAGVPPGMTVAAFRETRPDDWKPFLDLNLQGVLLCTRAVIDSMCDRGWGRVITISSGAGQIGIGLGVAAYGAGKGGGIAFMRHLAVEVAPHGVTANSIALGLIDNHMEPSVTEALARGVPTGRLGTPADVAAAAVYVASEEASWLTGQTIGLNGGFPTS
jgi:NAD(P)-dependent dehydrogenase (short-subunit alcohol dehydrogenase family)